MLHLTVLVFVVYHGGPRPALGEVVAKERAALVDIFISTGGPRWQDDLGWRDYANSTSDPCSTSGWLGVTCSSDGEHVV